MKKGLLRGGSLLQHIDTKKRKSSQDNVNFIHFYLKNPSENLNYKDKTLFFVKNGRVRIPDRISFALDILGKKPW